MTDPCPNPSIEVTPDWARDWAPSGWLGRLRRSLMQVDGETVLLPLLVAGLFSGTAVVLGALAVR